MAKIIAVHGTFENEQTGGSSWWQNGSDFERDVLRYVKANDGKVDFEPFTWESPNSEVARRAAGSKLLDEICRIEKAGEVCAIVAHSHGGSVIEHAALSAKKKFRVAWGNVSSLICIATPFLTGQARGGPFTRMGLGSKFFFTAFVMSFIAWIWVQVFLALMMFQGPQEDIERLKGHFGGFLPLIVVIAATTIGPFLVYYIWAWLRWGAHATVFNKKNNSTARSHPIKSRLVVLSHRHDEAIRALSSIPKRGPRVFDPAFAVPLLNSVAVYVLPIALVVGVYAIGIFTKEINGQPVDHSLLVNPLIAGAMTLSNHVEGLVRLLVEGLRGRQGMYLYLGATISTAANLVLYLFGGLLFVLAARALSRLLSRFVSAYLDKVVWSALRRNAFGSDVAGEIATGVRAVPFWVDGEWNPGLPDELENELTALADRSAGVAIQKIRISLGELVFAIGGESWSEKMTKHLDWGELIHTVYFRVPLFRKLVCCAIASSPGFYPSEELKSDPDFPKLIEWLGEIEARGRTSKQ
jgi:hypothetical protein